MPLASVPRLPLDSLRERLRDGKHVSALFMLDRIIFAVLADGPRLELLSAEVGPEYASLTPDAPQVHLFERSIHEEHGVRPTNHPWLKPVRFPGGAVGDIEYFAVAGEEVHEVGVGPVHAGIIEPGHFRFQCHGETVFHLEISLGYQHRGVERCLRGGPDRKTAHYIETLAGDSTIGHAWAYAENVEALAGTETEPETGLMRAILLELERAANHVGDLGALAGDVGFLPTQSFCGRIRGDFLNLSAALCGSRFGRSAVRPGRTACSIDDPAQFERLLDAAFRDAAGAVGLMFRSASVVDRLRDTGVLDHRAALDLGIVGPPARASGVAIDVRRHEELYGGIRIAAESAGDVLARALVRWQEVEASIGFIKQSLGRPGGSRREEAIRGLQEEMVCCALVEGWRGEICHVAITDAEGRFAEYKVFDPSFRNWSGLAMAMRGQEISDFPLCNKSFDLSYCGYDL
jgi:Ni,Fe-hydrogenase III large subunit